MEEIAGEDRVESDRFHVIKRGPHPATLCHERIRSQRFGERLLGDATVEVAQGRTTESSSKCVDLWVIGLGLETIE